MVLCYPWEDSCIHNWINTPNFDTKLSPKPWNVLPKNCRGLTQWAFVTLGLTLIHITESIFQNLTTKTVCPLSQQLQYAHQNNLRLSQNQLSPMMFINKYMWSLLLLPLLKIMQITIIRENLVWLNWIQEINWWW